jgi:DNA-binding MarR family transcriptional regulator
VEWLRVDRTTMVAVVDELERQELVVRRRLASDRRGYARELTSAGAALLARGREVIAEAETRALGALTVAERRRLHALLARLV